MQTCFVGLRFLKLEQGQVARSLHRAQEPQTQTLGLRYPASKSIEEETMKKRSQLLPRPPLLLNSMQQSEKEMNSNSI
jgi:hypothetical protein